MPRVTMNGGSPSRVTSTPLVAPRRSVIPMPRSSAVSGEPPPTTCLAMTMVPSTAIAPLARSIPAVRMMSVCPSASVPMTIDCWRMSEALPTVANVSVVTVKTTTAMTRAPSGPITGLRSARPSRSRRTTSTGAAAPVTTSGAMALLPSPGRRRSAPAVLQAPLGALRLDPLDRVVGDDDAAGVDEPGGHVAPVRRGDDGVHALPDHLGGELHDGGGVLAVGDVLHALAAAVDGPDDHLVGEVLRLERGIGAAGGRLVDGVDGVDVGVALEQVFHRGLGVVLVALGVLHPEDGGVTLLDPEAFEEAVVAEGVDRAAGGAVEHDERRVLVAEGGAHVGTLQPPGLEVVGGEGGVDGVLGVGRGVEGDDDDALGAGLLDRAEEAGGVVRRDHDAVHALGDEVLHGLHLALVVAVEGAGERGELHPLLLGVLRGHLAHGDEERVGLGLGDQTDADVPAATARVGRAAVPALRLAVGAAGRERQRPDRDHRGGESPVGPAGRASNGSHDVPPCIDCVPRHCVVPRVNQRYAPHASVCASVFVGPGPSRGKWVAWSPSPTSRAGPGCRRRPCRTCSTAPATSPSAPADACSRSSPTSTTCPTARPGRSCGPAPSSSAWRSRRSPTSTSAPSCTRWRRRRRRAATPSSSPTPTRTRRWRRRWSPHCAGTGSTACSSRRRAGPGRSSTDSRAPRCRRCSWTGRPTPASTRCARRTSSRWPIWSSTWPSSATGASRWSPAWRG